MRNKFQFASFLAVAALAAPLLAGGGSTGASPAAAPLAADFAHPAFQRTWARTDRPVSLGQVPRSWYWGPTPNTGSLLEDYAEGQGGKRLVQYFDKSRMEINDPNGNQNDPFFVTNGLLTVELISGRMQVGNQSYVNRAPAAIPLASDTDDPNAPTYISFQGVSNTTLGDHPAPNRSGQVATATINKAGTVGNDPAMSNFPGTTFAYYNGTTKHNIPAIFWDFLNLTGPVYDQASGQNVTARLSDPWYYTTGLPISEPYWAKVKIANQPNIDVMIQAFERRVVTYVPSAPEGFRVQMSNIGQHYYDWRYGGAPPPPTATPTVTPPPGSQHTPAQFAGTWINDDSSANSVGKLWIKAAGNNLTVKWFGVCSPGFCDNQEKTAAYSGEPFNITLDSRPFSLSLNDPATQLKVVYQGTTTLTFHRVVPADYVGTWINDDANTGSAAKLWIKAGANNLTVKWFGSCSPGFCDNQEKTAAYTSEPFNITLDSRTFAISLDTISGSKLKVIYQGNTELRFHRVTPADYAGTWLNDDASTGAAAKLWITAAGNNLTVKWFGACGGSLCDNEQKTVAYADEPFNVTLDGKTFSITLDRADARKLKVIYQGTTTLRFHKVQAADFKGTWVNVDAATTGIKRFEITTSGNTVNVHWFGACSPTPCDNGVETGTYGTEPLVINTTHAPTRTFTITFDNAGGTHLRVNTSNSPGPDRTDVLQKQP
jgi:hypothetical protein